MCPAADEDGTSVELESGRRCEEEGGGDETEQGEVSNDGTPAMGAAPGSCGRSEGGTGSQSALEGVWTISLVGNGSPGEDVRILVCTPAAGIYSRDEAAIAILLFDASTAPADGISPVLRFGESHG